MTAAPGTRSRLAQNRYHGNIQPTLGVVPRLTSLVQERRTWPAINLIQIVRKGIGTFRRCGVHARNSMITLAVHYLLLIVEHGLICGVRASIHSTGVVHEDRGAARDHVEVVVVVAGDCQVPHPAVVLLRRGAADDDRDSTVDGLEVLIFR